MQGGLVMWKRWPGILIVSVLGASVFADYVADREAAVKLQRAGKYQEALDAFLKMAGGEVTEVQKSDALHQAAYCAYRLKDYDQAMKLAERIPIEGESKATRLVLLNWMRKWKQAIAEFKSEDIAAWPDHVKYEAYRARGMSAYRIKDAELAVADLSMAAKYANTNNDRSLALCNLGDAYRVLLKDDEKALEVYRRVLAGGHLYKGSRASLAIAGIQLKQGKPEEALAALEWVDMNKVNGPYRAYVLAARANIFATMGKKTEAIEEYKKALAVKGVPDYIRKNCEKALEKLEGGEEKKP